LKGEGDEVGFRRVILKEVIQQAPPRGRTSTVEDMINCGERRESKTKETGCAILKCWVNRLRNGQKRLICHSYAVEKYHSCVKGQVRQFLLGKRDGSKCNMTECPTNPVLHRLLDMNETWWRILTVKLYVVDWARDMSFSATM
jgi:hypothetical protein